MSELPPAAVQCRGVAVHLGGRAVLHDLDLDVAAGRVVALLGASGAGKSTLLNAIAGFIPIEAGEIRLDGRLVAGGGAFVPPERRRVGVVFQDYALWPHMTVHQIVAYPLIVRGAPRHEAGERAEQWLARLGLGDLAGRRPDQLSGGQQQRVGLARALIAEPRVLLCDEPTANLDARLRTELPGEIRDEVVRSGAAGVYVTHDPSEAFTVADVVAVLEAGRILQAAGPAEVYARPASQTVAALTGLASFVRGGLRPDGSAELPGGTLLMVRPEWVDLAVDGGLQARVVDVRFTGDGTLYRLDSDAGCLLAHAGGEPRWGAGAAVSCAVRRAWALPQQPETSG
ncbi:MAG TPA: ABC transporter ATP-binding protein [Bacillota bacterium]|nr:ABC transporter ATP-binding protein [Bacillota bacterium]